MFMVQVSPQTVRSHSLTACVGQLVQLGGNPPGSGWWIVIRPATKDQHGLAIPAMFPHGFQITQTPVVARAA